MISLRTSGKAPEGPFAGGHAVIIEMDRLSGQVKIPARADASGRGLASLSDGLEAELPVYLSPSSRKTGIHVFSEREGGYSHHVFRHSAVNPGA
jgi:hypothetical protein